MEKWDSFCSGYGTCTDVVVRLGDRPDLVERSVSDPWFHIYVEGSPAAAVVVLATLGWSPTSLTTKGALILNRLWACLRGKWMTTPCTFLVLIKSSCFVSSICCQDPTTRRGHISGPVSRRGRAGGKRDKRNTSHDWIIARTVPLSGPTNYYRLYR